MIHHEKGLTSENGKKGWMNFSITYIYFCGAEQPHTVVQFAAILTCPLDFRIPLGLVPEEGGIWKLPPAPPPPPPGAPLWDLLGGALHTLSCTTMRSGLNVRPQLRQGTKLDWAACHCASCISAL